MLVARELSYYPAEELEVKQSPKKNYEDEKKQKQIRKQKNRRKSMQKLSVMSILMVALAISMVVLFKYASITSVRQEITKIEREKLDLEKTKMNLIADLEGIKTSSKISEDAMFKLGMIYPEEGQIIYISVEDGIENEKEPQIGFKAGIKNMFYMIVNLF